MNLEQSYAFLCENQMIVGIIVLLKNANRLCGAQNSQHDVTDI